MIGEHFIGLQDVVGGQRIEPSGDAETVVVLQSCASGGEQAVGSGLGQQRFDFLGAGVDQKSVGLPVFVAVIAALLGGKFLQKVSGDAGALQQMPVRPRSVPIHAAQKHVLVLVGAGAEVGIEDVRMRPEFQRQAENFENVAAHTAAGFLRFFDEWRQVLQG